MHRTTSTTLVTLALLALLAATPAAPQAVVSTLARDLEPLAATTDVVCSRFASFRDEPEVTVGMELEPGDLLASTTSEVVVELTCPGGSLLRFSGGFRVMINAPSEGSDCAVNFLSGTLDVLTDEPTEVNAGGVTLGSEGTQFSVELERDDGEPGWSCMVFDGRVRWDMPAAEERWLDADTVLRVAGRNPAVARIDEARIADWARARVAQRYALFDVARSRASGHQLTDSRAAVSELYRLHYDVLSRPADVDARVELARRQIDYRIPERADYNLDRAGVRVERDPRHERDPRRDQADVPPDTLDRLRRHVVKPLPDPVSLVEARRYEEAVELVKKKLEAGNVDSRDFYALAIAYRNLEGAASKNAVVMAKRAIQVHGGDGKLSPQELELARRVAAGR